MVEDRSTMLCHAGKMSGYYQDIYILKLKSSSHIVPWWCVLMSTNCYLLTWINTHFKSAHVKQCLISVCKHQLGHPCSQNSHPCKLVSQISKTVILLSLMEDNWNINACYLGPWSLVTKCTVNHVRIDLYFDWSMIFVFSEFLFHMAYVYFINIELFRFLTVSNQERILYLCILGCIEKQKQFLRKTFERRDRNTSYLCD